MNKAVPAVADIERNARSGQPTRGEVELASERRRLNRGTRINGQKFSDLGEIWQPCIQRRQDLRPGRNFEKRIVLSEDRLDPEKDFSRGKNCRRNVDLPALPWFVAPRSPGVTPIAVRYRQLPHLREEPQPRRGHFSESARRLNHRFFAKRWAGTASKRFPVVLVFCTTVQNIFILSWQPCGMQRSVSSELVGLK